MDDKGIKKKRTYELPERTIVLVKQIADDNGDSQNETVEMIVDYYLKYKHNKKKIEFKPCPIKFGEEGY